MSNYILSPQMNLPVPVVGTESGPAYATDINSCMAILDGHTHSSGSGTQITPSGLNINSALTLNNNLLINIRGLTLGTQTADLGPLNLYTKGNNLYWIGAGSAVQITNGNSIVGAAGTISGLPSGTASASYSSGTFTFQSATSTSASIDGQSFILRNNAANSFGLTLNPPNAMGANFALTLPILPAQTNVMTLDASGNMGSITYDAVGQNMTSTGANAIAATMTSTGANAIGLNMTTAAKNLASGSDRVVVSNTNATNSLAIVRGYFNSAGTISQGEGFSVTHNGTGDWTVTFTTAFGDKAVVTANPDDTDATITVNTISTSTVGLFSFTPSAPVNVGISFIAIGQRA